jgi:signal recognition particle receptor subunit beta
MVQINFARREVNCKIVFYGPGLSGKTTNLEIIHKKVPDTARGNLTSIATEQDRTLFFDFMPLDLGQVAGMKTKLFLYTVPGQVYYDSTRKLVLQGADGVSFIADSDPNRMNDNIESFKNLEKNLKEYGVDIRKIPLVIQYNKRDLPGALSIAELNAKVNPIGAPTFEAVAVKGEGVMQTLKGISKLVVDRLNEEYAPVKTAATPTPAPAARPASAPAVAAPPPRTAVAAAAAPAARPAAVASPPPRPVPAAPPPRPAAAPPPPARPAPAPRPAPAVAAAPPPPAPQKKGGKGGLVVVLILLLLLGGFAAAWHLGKIPNLPPAPWLPKK